MIIHVIGVYQRHEQCMLSQVTTVEEAQQVLGEVNGIFMTGGEDWNPKLYNQTQSPHGSSGYNDARDTSDILLMQNAIALDVPMLAVCRGQCLPAPGPGGAEDRPGEFPGRGGVPRDLRHHHPDRGL